MSSRRFAVVAGLAAAVALGLLPAADALSASNTVPGSRASKTTTPITANTLKPPDCAGITLTTVLTTSSGTAASELILGSAAANTITAAGGDDCILGGGGNDSINCGVGTDVAIGGPGTDTFNANCETQIP